ncbi:MAG: type II toxin-antitoxin system RelB/DinJ family antitoxin [Nitrospinae bacterium]|nr:type II toxin-antitoxin system RelB/DinJ family antitoxin [Nitrospinota bacterium]MBF0634581.1 type II toxin-antitoxin system RelB/DinJ family antitoxin [Nitrospinota bacterium]
MMADTMIRSRIDPKTKREANRLFKSLGLNMSDAIRLFLYQAIAQRGLPFDVKVPNAQTGAAIDELTKGEGEKVTLERLKSEWNEACAR